MLVGRSGSPTLPAHGQLLALSVRKGKDRLGLELASLLFGRCQLVGRGRGFRLNALCFFQIFARAGPAAAITV